MNKFIGNEKIIIVTGHYGAGKTNLCINLATLLPFSTVIADLDIVNPFFRTADFAELLVKEGVRLSVSDYANSSLDIPSLNLCIKGELSKSDRLIIDVGGDGEGAKALGRFAEEIEEIGYEMLYVVNKYRLLTASPEEAVTVMREIEKSSGLSCTAIVNNSNLGNETTAETVADSADYAKKISELTGLPLTEIPVKVYVKQKWET